MDSWKRDPARPFETPFGWEMLNFKFSKVRLLNDDSKKVHGQSGIQFKYSRNSLLQKLEHQISRLEICKNSADARNHGGKNPQTSRRSGLLCVSAWIKFSRLPKIWVSSKSIIDSVKNISNIAKRFDAVIRCFDKAHPLENSQAHLRSIFRSLKCATSHFTS